MFPHVCIIRGVSDVYGQQANIEPRSDEGAASSGFPGD